jgi:hypothetical protein
MIVNYIPPGMLSPRRKQEQLTVVCSDPGAHDAITAAIDRVPGFSVPHTLPPAEQRLQAGIASLAIGDRVFSRALLEHLDGAEYLLLVARYFLWSGNDALLRAELPRVDQALQETDPFAELHELAVALESIGADAEASAVRSRCADAQRRMLPPWEARGCEQLPTTGAFDTVNVFIHALLGVAPDAPRGRLRLRLCLPESWQTLSVENLRMADALVLLQCTRDDGHFSYVVEQIAGAMPVRLIFEPTFTRPPANVLIDDVPARLDLRPHGPERVIAPVQLMLDHQRVLRFMT